MDDLWPQIFKRAKAVPPRSILEAQATYLGKRTNNIVTGEVQQQEPRGYQYRTLPFIYSFWLVAPGLGNYRFLLFVIAHDVDLYPVFVYPDEKLGNEIDAKPTSFPKSKGVAVVEDEASVRADDKEEFETILRAMFSAQRTQSIIGSLLAQSVEYRGYKPDDDIPF